jgi:hypothetical protein
MNKPDNTPNNDYREILILLKSLDIKTEALISLVQKLETKINDIQKRIDTDTFDDDMPLDSDLMSNGLVPDNIINDLAQEIITSKNMGLPKDTPINHVSLTIDLSKKDGES